MLWLTEMIYQKQYLEKTVIYSKKNLGLGISNSTVCGPKIDIWSRYTVGELKDLTVNRACVVKLPLLRAVSAGQG